MNDLAEEFNFVVMYPEQPASTHPQRCWRWYEPAHQQAGGGEPALIAAAVHEVLREFRADPDRVYVAGVSAGGAMAVILAAGYPDRFAAAGSHSGIAYGAAAGAVEALRTMQQPPPAPAPLPASGHARVPLIIFHGADDRVVHSGHAGVLAAQWAGSAVLEERHGAGAGRGYLHLSAKGSVAVEGWVIDGLGHAWSGGSAQGSYTEPEGPDASREMVRFFLAHRRPTTR